MRGLIVSILVAACGPSKVPPGRQFDRDTATADLATVQKQLGQDPFDLCVSVERAQKSLAADPTAAKLLKDGARVCEHDAPLAFGQAIEKRLTPTPAPEDCLDLELVLERLEPAYAAEPAVKSLHDTRDARCK